MNSTKQFVRKDGRTCNQVRPISLQYDVFGYADCSVLLSIGGTKVLVSVSLQDGVPAFLRKTGTGWLTAEYAMLPSATRIRTPRESEQMRKQGRSVEIARLIGRSLRSIINFKEIGERTITIDCDVLQADGGTRAACITAASYALSRALVRWQAKGAVPSSIVLRPIVALSAGLVENELLVDLSQQEDNAATADVTFVVADGGDIVEMQVTSEKEPVSWTTVVALKEMTVFAADELFKLK
jgi:ribonuclease PH